jgi:hypothetical protein
MVQSGSTPSTRRVAAALLIIGGLLWSCGPARLTAAGQGKPTIDQLEASVVMTFARFVEWPVERFPSPASPILVGVVGDELLAVALEATSRGKTIAGRTMTVARLQWDSDFAGVHMLFLGEAQKRHLGVVLERVRPHPVVTISPLPEFGRSGGMITLTFSDGRIRFAVNSRATARSGVRLSAFLLSHASKVSAESAGARQ